MKIRQFEDKHLSHYSYAIVSECEQKMVLIDPARAVQPYLDYAKEMEATIVGIIETHPHADFVSSHLELYQRLGATIYTSKLVEAVYPHEGFDEGQSIHIGKIKLFAINTPGHSPDSISVLLEHDGSPKAVFTGDTLFVGDCGRPDLREGSGKMQAKREDLARQMYHSLREKLAVLPDDVIVYPAHGAGTLCGKNLGKESSSTIGKEKQSNWSLQEATEKDFVKNLLADQPFVPAYFPYDVELNRQGAANMQQSIAAIHISEEKSIPDHLPWVVDVRQEADFKAGHLPHAINLMEDGKFETWLGSIIKPGEKFYLAGENKDQVQRMIQRTASIGYESAVIEGLVIRSGKEKETEIDLPAFKNDTEAYTIVDVRNASEVKQEKIFPNSISIPLAEIRERVHEIPTDKPIVVHCAGGYRSAAASSLIHSTLNGKASVMDLGEAVKNFEKTTK
ncbi:MAG TPA: rhodanese-like domain-containing protein [Flavisolibacter sp.]|nr:rhodanese-like domain-containing protein [Flavisolibacter sp.]